MKFITIFAAIASLCALALQAKLQRDFENAGYSQLGLDRSQNDAIKRVDEAGDSVWLIAKDTALSLTELMGTVNALNVIPGTAPTTHVLTVTGSTANSPFPVTVDLRLHTNGTVTWTQPEDGNK